MIIRYGKDAQGKDCPEGWYAHDGRGVVLMPPTAESYTAKGPGRIVTRPATQAEVDAALKAGAVQAACIEHCAGAVAAPSDAKDE